MPSRKILPHAVLAAGIATSAIAGLLIRADAEREAKLVFAHEADEVTGLILGRLDTLGLVLRGGAAAFADPQHPKPEEWKTFTRQLQPQLTLPGVQGIGFVQLIQPQQLAEHLATMRSWGFPEYSITPEGTRDLYTSIILLEPFDSRNQRAFGYDMYSDAVRREAMDLASETGMPALSAKVTLLQENGPNPQAGTLMYFPVFRVDPAQTDSNSRQDSLLGWTYSPLRMTDFINGIVSDWHQQWGDEIELFIYDGNTTDAASLLYSSVPADTTAPAQDMQQHEHRTLNFDGRQWTLMFDYANGAAGIDTTLAWLSFGSGLIISGLMYSLLLSLRNVRERSQALASKLTAELREERERLADSEYRWKFALEGAGDGLWDWNIPEARIFYSPTWRAMLGYADDDFGDAEKEWSSRIHPDDVAAVTKRVEDYLEGRSPSYSSEHRMLCKDGSYKWILDRGMVVTRDSDGRPLRMLGTHKDISDRKLMEEGLKQKQSELIEAQRIAKVGNWSVEIATGKIEWAETLSIMMGLDPTEGPPSYEMQQHLHTPASWSRLQHHISRAITHGERYEIELEIVKPDGQLAFLLAAGEPARREDGKITHVRGTATDITELVQSRRRAEQLAQQYAALSAGNDAIVHCKTADELLARACEVVVTHGRMSLAWIGITDKATGALVPRHWYGTGGDYVQGIDISVRADQPTGRGPTGTAVRENRPMWIDDFRTNEMTRHWQQRASRFGWISSAALPLCRFGEPIGALTFYSTESNWFTAEIRALLEQLVLNLGFALDKFEIESEAERYEATLKEAEQRFRSLIEQPLVGAFIVQNHRFVYVNPQLETILGYAHDGSIYHVSPDNIVGPRDRAAVQAQLDSLLTGEISRFEAVFSAMRADGSSVDAGMTISASIYQQQPAIIGLIQDLSNRQVAEAHIKRYANNLEKVFLQTVSMVTNLVEMRDPYTVGHEMRVADIAVAIGREMQLTLQQLEGLRVGGYLHDVGKVAVPSEILAKPGRITAIEYELIKGHPEAGYQILKDVEFPWPVAEIAYQHHERVDGSGYPRGLKGEEILLEARIVAVADVVESMFSHRPYRAGLGIEKALAEIEQGRGTRYDATVADCCLRLFREKGFTLEH